MKEIIFLNGKFIPQEEAKLPVITPGFLYGWGLFETMRSYRARIACFDEHLKRLMLSSKSLGIMPLYSADKLKEIIGNAVKLSGIRDAYVRLTLWKSEKRADVLVTVKEYHAYSLEEYAKGFRACVSSFRQNESSYFARHKTTNYLPYRLAYLEAIKKGFDEALLLNNKGYAAETSRCNLFFAKEKELFTPSLECGCLDGITRRAVLNLAKKYNIEAYEGNFTASDLYSCDEAFLTNSLIGIMPLTYLEKSPIAKGSPGRITGFFMKKYRALFQCKR